jgi:hypothetical protein
MAVNAVDVEHASKAHREHEPRASKRPRFECDRPDRVKLNVGGTIFHTTRSTLAAGSCYFESRFSTDWVQEEPEAELFLDRDPDVFRVLLSCMRSRHVVLPEHDQALATRVLLDAEFYGLDWLLAEVKLKAWMHMHPDHPAAADALKAFDNKFPSLQDAITAHVLPSRFFRSAPEVVQQLIPAMAHDRIVFTNTGVARAALGYALVRQPDGTTRVDALIARNEELDMPEDRDDKQIVLASAYRQESLDSLRDAGMLDPEQGQFRSWSVVSGARGDPERREYKCAMLSQPSGDQSMGAEQIDDWIHGGWAPKHMCCSRNQQDQDSQIYVLLERDRSVTNDDPGI